MLLIFCHVNILLIRTGKETAATLRLLLLSHLWCQFSPLPMPSQLSMEPAKDQQLFVALGDPQQHRTEAEKQIRGKLCAVPPGMALGIAWAGCRWAWSEAGPVLRSSC